MEYNLEEVIQALENSGYVKFSSHDAQSAIIKSYEFWLNNELDKSFCLEIWKNNNVFIFKQTVIEEILEE
jgi:hypothetical protein